MKTVDLKFYKLCEEIDYWKDQAEYWKNKFEEERNENIQQSNERLLEAKKGVANALMLALSVKDNEDGSLSISRENRELLAQNYKS